MGAKNFADENGVKNPVKGLERPIVVMHVLLLCCMDLHCIAWPFTVLSGPFMVLYPFHSLLLQKIDLIGLVWPFLAVIDPNSFGFVAT